MCSPPDTEWDSTIAAVMRREAQSSLSGPLDGWPTSEQEWVTTIGRQVYSDDVFSLNLSPLPRHHIRSKRDILTSAMKYVGAERVANEDFWTLVSHPVATAAYDNHMAGKRDF